MKVPIKSVFMISLYCQQYDAKTDFYYGSPSVKFQLA